MWHPLVAQWISRTGLSDGRVRGPRSMLTACSIIAVVSTAQTTPHLGLYRTKNRARLRYFKVYDEDLVFYNAYTGRLHIIRRTSVETIMRWHNGQGGPSHVYHPVYRRLTVTYDNGWLDNGLFGSDRPR